MGGKSINDTRAPLVLAHNQLHCQAHWIFFSLVCSIKEHICYDQWVESPSQLTGQPIDTKGINFCSGIWQRSNEWNVPVHRLQTGLPLSVDWQASRYTGAAFCRLEFSHWLIFYH